MNRAFEELTSQHFDVFIDQYGHSRCEISEPGRAIRAPNQTEVNILTTLVSEKIPEAMRPREPGDRVSVYLDRASLSFRASVYLAKKDLITSCVGALPEPIELGADEVDRFLKEFTRNSQFFARLTMQQTERGTIFQEEVLAESTATNEALGEMKTPQSQNTLDLMLRKLNQAVFKNAIKELETGESVEIDIDLKRGYYAGEKIMASGAKKKIAGLAKPNRAPKPSEQQSYRL